MRRKRVKKIEEKSSSTSELDKVVFSINKRYGENSARKASLIYQPDRISTGVFTLDFALLGGVPISRQSMFVGERSSGKSTLASKVIANSQRQHPEKKCIWIDLEGTQDSLWMEQLGVDLDELIFVECETGEQAVDISCAAAGAYDTSLIVVDSLAALEPAKELENSAEDVLVGTQARLIGNLLRRMTATIIAERKRNHYVSVLYINQLRVAVGKLFGDPRVIPGGKAVEFFPALSVSLRNKENKGKSEDGIDNVAYNEHAFTIMKNKVNAGPRTGEFILIRDADNDKGLMPGQIDDFATVLSFAKKMNLYTGAGRAWKLEFDDYSYNFGKADEAIEALMDDQELYWGLRTHLIKLQAAKLGMNDDFIERIV